MSYKTPSHKDVTTMPLSSVAFKRVKRLRLFESSLPLLAAFFIVCACLTASLFYRHFTTTFVASAQSQSFSSLHIKTSEEEVRLKLLGQKGGACDFFDGKWVWDDNYPLYQSKDCVFLDEGFRCSENGRPDLFYTKWRWQPKDCNLPRFNAKVMLEKLRNKRVVFAGDSIGRNQWESLLCMLSSGVTNKESIYEVNGSPITKHKGFLVFKFRDFNCTVEYYRAPFLVLQSRRPSAAPPKVKTTLKLHKMDWYSLKWTHADVLVLNTGHWWNYEKTIRGGCYFQEGKEINMGMRVEDAYKRAIETVVNWVHGAVNSSKTQVFFRTFSPVHFRGGDWRHGGRCHLETLPELGTSLVPTDNWSQFKIANAVLSQYSNTSKLKILNVTHMTAQRKDGHSSLYYLGPNVGPAPTHRQDCSHWCLPGVPDAWNELLYALLLNYQLSDSFTDKAF